MAKRRLNDTAALTAAPARYGQDYNVSSRKIENGYVVRESMCDPQTGEYRSSERFSKEQPKIVPAKVSRGGAGEGPSALADTMKYLSDGE